MNRRRSAAWRRWLAGFAVYAAGAAWAADTRYSVSADGQEVTDLLTGLVWRRCAEGMRQAGDRCAGTPTSFTHDAAVRHAATQADRSGKPWRVPGINELTSLIDRTRRHAAIDEQAFPATPADYFWSSSPFVGERNSVWFVDFGEGYVYDVIRTASHSLRLVRNAR